MLNINLPLTSVPRITPKYAKALEKLGLLTIRDFLQYFPFRYDDFSKNIQLSDEYIGEIVTICGKIVSTKLNRIFKRKLTIAEVICEDENGTLLKATWFNQPFIIENLAVGSVVRLSGKLDLKGKYYTLSAPAWEKASREETNTGRLVPIYSETPGITSKWIRWQMKTLIDTGKQLPDYVPTDLRKKLHLYSLFSALGQIHFPEDLEKLQIAQKTFAFREIFLMQLKSLQVKHDWEINHAIEFKFDTKLIEDFTNNLPFSLTNAQKKASLEILYDLEKKCPMNRLLNGDVGAGKTIVAAISALEVISKKHQVAILAPTEVLAKQHFESLCKLFKKYNFKIALVTGSYKIINAEESTRKNVLEKIHSGEINLIIGTHAIIQKDVKFKNLALVIIDEQHRFGVMQRAMLLQEAMDLKDGEIKTIPHLLTMTATPIPRTLAIAFFGSLDLSILDEMPKNRKSIITKIVVPEQRNQVYNFMRSEITAGRQVFVIFPLVNESEKLTEVKAATAEYKKLIEIFPQYKIGLMHGKLKPKDKEQVMQDFKDKKTWILVSTSVVEVGIDIPNATIMIIENADRFGLAQLHQFRGRVGRGENQSYCFLFTESTNQTSLERLIALEKSNDGFELSQKDLDSRGPGQLLGRVQSGLSDIAMKNLSNLKLIKIARAEAENILRADPKLKKHPLLADALKIFSEKIHLE
ncbi:MAG: ATP-dependent DNA helicase RecG [Candidatus Moraniibacteriota bacterium]